MQSSSQICSSFSFSFFSPRLIQACMYGKPLWLELLRYPTVNKCPHSYHWTSSGSSVVTWAANPAPYFSDASLESDHSILSPEMHIQGLVKMLKVVRRMSNRGRLQALHLILEKVVASCLCRVCETNVSNHSNRCEDRRNNEEKRIWNTHDWE